MCISAPAIHVAITALRTKMPELSPSSKFLFIRGMLLLDNGVSGDKQDKIASAVGMPVQALVAARRELVDAGYASLNPTASQNVQRLGVATQGRFRHGFALDADRVHQIRLEAVGLKMYAPSLPTEMLKLFILKESVPALKLPNGMRARHGTMLLMLVLLALSDEFGVVWNCSRGRLAELTGYSKGQINSQLGKLQSAGVLRHMVPGINGGLFSRSPGAILLNFGNGPLSHLLHQPPPLEYFSLPERELKALEAFRALFKRRPPAPDVVRDRLPHEVNIYIDEEVKALLGRGGNPWSEELEIDVTKAICRVLKSFLAKGQRGAFGHAVYKLCECASREFRSQSEFRDRWPRYIQPSRAEDGPVITGTRPNSSVDECVLRAIFRCYGSYLARNIIKVVRERVVGQSEEVETLPGWAVIPGPYDQSQIYLVRQSQSMVLPI